MTRRLCIALHDVAPATWPHCERWLGLLDALGAPPLTLLVVPHWHGGQRIDAAPAFLRALDARRARGDEIALHGFYHRDESAAPTGVGDWFRRRVLTAGEGEFAALSEEVAAARIADGLSLLRAQGWPVEGFVPPAWLAGAGARAAIRKAGLRWTSTHGALYALDGGARRIAAPCLTASPRSAWRRMASRIWLRAALQATAAAPLLRVGLHPDDADHAALLANWRKLLGVLLARREAVVKRAAVGESACVAPAPC